MLRSHAGAYVKKCVTNKLPAALQKLPVPTIKGFFETPPKLSQEETKALIDNIEYSTRDPHIQPKK